VSYGVNETSHIMHINTWMNARDSMKVFKLIRKRKEGSEPYGARDGRLRIL